MRIIGKIAAKLLIIVLLCLSVITNASAARGNKLQAKNTYTPRMTSLVVDASNGMILHEENADKVRYPASLTKMMTLYLTFEALKNGTLHNKQSLIVSKSAIRPRMNMGLKAGDMITVREAILSAIVKSANDASVVLAEANSGSEMKFVEKMNQRAKQLGMNNTTFHNATGFHHPEQVTTAYDMVKLALSLKRDFPEYYHLFSTTSFVFKGVQHYGHNRVLKNYPGATGLKTGFVNASGFNIVTTAHRHGKELVGVVMGGTTAQNRDIKVTTLLNKYFGTNPTKIMANETKPIIKNKQSKRLAKAKSKKKSV